jgi:hypothetical protein
MLAGVSVDYYGRLERGNLAGASESVLEAVARALRLDDAERQHLLDLARRADPPSPSLPSRKKASSMPREAVFSILAGLTIPAYVRTPRMEMVAANEVCQALYGGALDDDRLPLNLARYLFLDPHSRGIFSVGLSANYGDPVDTEHGNSLIRGAHDQGVTLFDTAEAYGPFTNETLVGEAIEPIRDRIVIATVTAYNQSRFFDWGQR